VTDGVTDGRDDETTALVVPQQAPARAEARPDAPADGRPTVVLLGSGDISRELAIDLGRLGARVIAVDQHPHAPAHGVADQALVLPLTDAAELSAALQRLQPDFVVTATDAVAGPALEALEGLTATGSGGNHTQLVPSARTVRLSADREGLRRLAADELGLPTAPFWFAGSLGELEAVGAHAGYPLLVKPVAGPAGPGQSVVARREDLGPAWQRAAGAHAGPGQPRVLAETVVEVEFYVTLLAVRSEGPAGPAIEFCSPIGHRGSGGQVLESWQPQNLSAAATDAAKSIAARIVKALGGRGVFAVELMINGDEVYFADVTSRPTDSAWVTLRSQRLSAFELQARTILGLPVDTMMVSPAAARAIERVDSHDPAALSGALSVPESDLRLVGRGYRALATAPEVTAARERAGQVAGRLAAPETRG
jgi:phosphoribosylglycinamide formyltransferase 2